MRQKERIEIDHTRKVDFLGNIVCLQNGVQNLLITLDVELHPARISLREAITMIGVN